MNLVCMTHAPVPPSVSHSMLVRWLGPNAISALAIDGKDGKAEMLERVAQWVAASGRNVSQPGIYILSCSHITQVDLCV